MEQLEPSRQTKQFIRMQRLLDQLPRFGMDIAAAAREVGLWSDSYIKTGQLARNLRRNVWFCKQYDQLCRTQLQKNKNTAETLDELIRSLINVGEYKGQPITPTNMIRLVDMLYKRSGAYDKAAISDDSTPAMSKADLDKAHQQGVKLLQSMGKGA